MTIRDTFMDYNDTKTLCNYMGPPILKNTTDGIVRPVRNATKFPSVLRGMNNAVKLGIREELCATTIQNACRPDVRNNQQSTT